VREAGLQDYSAFLFEFQSETDRGATLVGAAMIDDRLEETLRAFIRLSAGVAELTASRVGKVLKPSLPSVKIMIVDQYDMSYIRTSIA
jgi:hypothetical protein